MYQIVFGIDIVWCLKLKYINTILYQYVNVKLLFPIKIYKRLRK